MNSPPPASACTHPNATPPHTHPTLTQHAQASSHTGARRPTLAPPTTPVVAVVMVTWNRAPAARAAIESVLAQRGVDRSALHLVVVDNASTDGTTDALAQWLRPERLARNDTTDATRPAFNLCETGDHNAPGLAGVTLVRNTHNLGGTGGFNTGFLAVERLLEPRAGVEFLWLLDDDAAADAGALASLLRTAREDPKAGLIGSRAVDIADRTTTYETTIYYDPRAGRMDDTPHPGHRLEAAHHEWIARVGASRGVHPFTGVREVDVASACSLLARWSVVRQVGYWDGRYFIYCDDADWCRRVARAGSRVLCDLDAVVYHTPWYQKLTPTRLYYAQRNAIWTMRKGLSGLALRAATARWMLAVLRASLAAGLRRRRFHAEILRRTALDAAANRPGPLDHAEPPSEPIEHALERLGLALPHARLALLCCTPHHADLARAIAGHLRDTLGPRCPAFVLVTRRDAGPIELDPPAARRVVYSPGTFSRVVAPWPLWLRPAHACIVLNNTNDFPLQRCPWTLHADHRTPTRCQVERDTLAGRAAFLARWIYAAGRAALFVVLSPRQRPKAPFG